MSPAADHAARSRRATRALQQGALVVVLSVAAIALAGLGSRWGWWHFRTGFTILRWGSYMALAGALLALAGALTRPSGRGRALALALPLVALALITVSVPWQWRRTARAVPPIHDITTDTEDPPPFVALRDRRTGATNPVEYGGPEVAAQQRAGYPDLAPAVLRVPPAQAVARAADVARDLGWEVVAVDTAGGRVEATDRTRWFGFYDDVVVRVRPADGGARVDVRSLSRVGGSDVGTNARRIRTFLERLREGA
jgi:uncharacterized protein (DUF1499 family)